MPNSSDNSGAPRRELIATAARGGILGLAGMLCGRFMVLILQVVVSRLYGPRYLGLFITGMLLLQLSAILAGLGLHKGGMRYLAIACERKDVGSIRNVLFSASMFPLLASLFIAAGMYILSPFLSRVAFNDLDMVEIVRWFAFATPFFTMLRVASELSRAFKTVRYSVLIEDVGFPLLQVALFIFLHWLHPCFMVVIYSFIISAAVCSIAMRFQLQRQVVRFLERFHLGSLKTGRLMSRDWKEILLYSLPIMPMGLLLIANHFMDILMLNILLPTRSVGVYAAASKWTLFFVMLIQPVMAIFGPLIASQYGVNRRRHVQVLYKTASRWLFLLSLPLFVFIFDGSLPLMSIFGPDFMDAGPKIVMILIIGCLFNSVRGVAGLLLSMVGLQRIELALIACTLMFNLTLNVLLIPLYGGIGAAWATTISVICLDLVRMGVVWRHYRVWPFSRRFIAPSIATGIAMLAGFIFSRIVSNVCFSMTVVASIAAVAVFVVSLTTGFSRSDRKLASEFVGKLKRKLGKPHEFPPRDYSREDGGDRLFRVGVD